MQSLNTWEELEKDLGIVYRSGGFNKRSKLSTKLRKTGKIVNQFKIHIPDELRKNFEEHMNAKVCESNHNDLLDRKEVQDLEQSSDEDSKTLNTNDDILTSTVIISNGEKLVEENIVEEQPKFDKSHLISPIRISCKKNAKSDLSDLSNNSFHNKSLNSHNTDIKNKANKSFHSYEDELEGNSMSDKDYGNDTKMSMSNEPFLDDLVEVDMSKSTTEQHYKSLSSFSNTSSKNDALPTVDSLQDIVASAKEFLSKFKVNSPIPSHQFHVEKLQTISAEVTKTQHRIKAYEMEPPQFNPMSYNHMKHSNNYATAHMNHVVEHLAHWRYSIERKLLNSD